MSDATSSKDAKKGGTPEASAKRQPLPRVPWNPVAAVFFVGFLYIASSIVAAGLVSIYPALKHVTVSTTDWLNNSVGAQFAFVVLAESFTVGAIYMFLRLYKLGFGDIGLKRPRWTDPLFGLASLPVYFFLYAVAVAVVSHFDPSLNVSQRQDIGFNNVQGSLQMTLTFISLVVLPPLAEEIMVRGFLYSSLKKALPVVWAAIVTSALFAAAHLPEGGSSGPLYIAAVDTFVLSMVLVYLRESTGNLWAGITLHAAKNSVAFITLFVLHSR